MKLKEGGLKDIKPHIKRECGRCTACCHTHPIQELEKEANKWCIHCDIGKRCKIYVERPTPCRTFECQWLKGLFHQSQRPDKTGIVVDYVEYDFDSKKMRTGILWEETEGALDKKFAAHARDFLSGMKMSVLLLPIHGTPTLYLQNRFYKGQSFEVLDGKLVRVVPLPPDPSQLT